MFRLSLPLLPRILMKSLVPPGGHFAHPGINRRIPASEKLRKEPAGLRSSPSRVVGRWRTAPRLSQPAGSPSMQFFGRALRERETDSRFFREANAVNGWFFLFWVVSLCLKKRNLSFIERAKRANEKNPQTVNTKLMIFCQVILPKKCLKIEMMEYWNMGKTSLASTIPLFPYSSTPVLLIIFLPLAPDEEPWYDGPPRQGRIGIQPKGRRKR